MKRCIAVCVLLGAIAAAVSAQKTQAGFYLDQNVQVSYNSLGLQFVTRLYDRLPLVQRSGMLWESTKIDVGLQNNLSPAYDMAGAYLDIAPIAIFDVAFTAQAIGYYDLLGFGFYTLTGYSAPFDSGSLGALTPKNTIGYMLSATPTLKLAVGPIAMLDSFGAMYFSVDDGSGPSRTPSS